MTKILTSVNDYRTKLRLNSSDVRLYIPGTVYYLYKGSEGNVMCEKSRPDLFTDIILRKNWLFHHFPDRYDKKFKGITKFLLRILNT